ncbi:MAG: hypothetical protein ACLFRT_13925 [Actinomycetota bacterium]
MQWQEMAWPLLWDPFNILGFPVVPVTYLLDTSGKVLLVQPLLDRVDDIIDRIADESAAPGGSPDAGQVRSGPTSRAGKAPAANADPRTWSEHSVSLAMWEGTDRIGEAVDAAARAAQRSDDPVHWFRLGVVLRMRYDSEFRQAGDFSDAVNAWSRALDADPNQYIWRRRLQQYGPRLAKPYPFYDWVPRARQDILSRGEQPTELVVEPHGAEYAQPASDIQTESTMDKGSEPDPEARVQADNRGLIEVETVVIPSAPRPGDSVRIHLILTPAHTRDAHWNNEAGYSELWVDPPPGWKINDNHQHLPVGTGDVSDETRHLELEVAVPDTAETSETINGYLLYYVCEGSAGVCVYLRQDLEISIPIATSDTALGLAE